MKGDLQIWIFEFFLDCPNILQYAKIGHYCRYNEEEMQVKGPWNLPVFIIKLLTLL